MVRPKLSFEVDADKVKAIADYVRTHVSSISFLGKAKGLEVKSAILEPGTIQPQSERGCVISLWRTLFYVIYCIILEVS